MKEKEDLQLLDVYRRSLIHLSITCVNSTNAHANQAIQSVILQEEDINCELLIIIPVYKRVSHLRAVVNCLKSQISNLDDPTTVGLVVSEMDDEPLHDTFCKETGVSYHFMKKVKGEFNKSAAMNYAHRSFVTETGQAPKFVLFHDVDILTEDGWVESCLSNARSFQASLPAGEGWICQTIKDRKLEYVSRENTEKYFANKLSLDELSQIPHAISDRWYEQIYPPGGSIMLNAPLLYASCGYDQALFWGYSPEDKHFLDICQLLAPDCFLKFDSSKRSYHLYHENLELTNNCLEHMVAISGVIKCDMSLFCYHQAFKMATHIIFPQMQDPTFYPLLNAANSEPGILNLLNNSFTMLERGHLSAIYEKNRPLARFIATYLKHNVPDHPLVAEK